jgi:hypothetical protein
MGVGMALLFGETKIKNVFALFDGFIAEGIDRRSLLQIRLGEFESRCFKIKTVGR